MTPAARLTRGLHATKGDEVVIPVTDESSKQSAALTGAATGYFFGGPILGAIGGAGANYLANKVG
jgi:hypothetical protein